MALLVLKPKHSLVNVPPFRLINKLREADTPPMAWAHLKKGHAVVNYSKEQLQTELGGFVGAPAADILAAASKPITKVNIIYVLSMIIVSEYDTLIVIIPDIFGCAFPMASLLHALNLVILVLLIFIL